MQELVLLDWGSGEDGTRLFFFAGHRVSAIGRGTRQSHLSGSGLFVPFERSRNSRPPCAHALIPPHFPGISPAIGGCGAAFARRSVQNLFGGLSTASDFVDLVQNDFCTRPVAHQRHDLAGLGPRYRARLGVVRVLRPLCLGYVSIRQTGSQHAIALIPGVPSCNPRPPSSFY